MKHANFTKQERAIIIWLRLLTACFTLFTLLFAIHPTYLLQYADSVGYVFFQFTSEAIDPPQMSFWWTLSLGLMAALTYLTFQAGRDWLRFQLYVPPVLIAKLVTTAGFWLAWVFQPVHFFYIIGGIIDSLIFLTTWILYAQAIKSRSFAKSYF